MARLVKALMLFTIVNVTGICLFYAWVFINQPHTRKFRSSQVVILGGDVDVENDRQKDFLPEVKPTVMTNAKSHKFLHKIPPVPEFSDTDSIPSLEYSIMEVNLAYPERPANQTVLILTPVHNVEGHLETYLRLLQSITYPHLLISVALGEDSSHDNTLHVAEEIAEQLRKSFRKVNVFHFNITGQVKGPWSDIHSKMNQYKRRRHLAQARNLLLKFALRRQISSVRKYDWVLWIDSDIISLPPDIIQQLMSAEKDVVAPLCVYMDGKNKRVYDKNTWRETRASLDAQKILLKREAVFEGYGPTKRLWLSDLRSEGRVVPIDGVGGCTLLVRAKCHVSGLVFPETPFQHHMETEGLAKMAKSMGFSVYGMPFVEVMH